MENQEDRQRRIYSLESQIGSLDEVIRRDLARLFDIEVDGAPVNRNYIDEIGQIKTRLENLERKKEELREELESL